VKKGSEDDLMRMLIKNMNCLFAKMRLHWLGATLLLFGLCFVALHYSEMELPRPLSSNGFMAIVGALIGVMLTAFAVSIQLKHQADSVTQRDRDIKIFDRKIRIYSEFTKKIWDVLDDGKVEDSELRELRTICFRTLVFYLDSDQIRKMTKQIDLLQDMPMRAASEITHILQENLNVCEKTKLDEDGRLDNLKELFRSFGKLNNKDEPVQQEPRQRATGPAYWHFSISCEKQQIDAFKRGNWVLALLEHGDDRWRTNLIKDVKPNDLIFLFRRGNCDYCGYIGVFRAKGQTPYKILAADTAHSDNDRKIYDIYDGLEDGASMALNILVEPIAYNAKGVGGYTVKRKTIERMNDLETVKFLLNRFNGNELDADHLAGKGVFDNGEKVPVNEEYFMGVLKQSNL